MYALTGNQVEPAASYWTESPRAPARSLSIMQDLTRLTDDPDHPFYFPAWDPTQVSAEIAALKNLALTRGAALPAGTISTLLQTRPQPLGAVVKKKASTQPVIQTGEELARWFEAETPGLGHRHALNQLILTSGWSPPRQARVWAALDLAIESAILAAWHYKWYTNRADVRYRLRPIEADPTLSVLYNAAPNPADFEVVGVGAPSTTASGTPRHPAYPSGHSTVGAAASEVLAFFFPAVAVEIRKLGDNAGQARLWAGVHYASDHAGGQKLGKAVAALIIRQLEADGVGDPIPFPAPPTHEALLAHA